MRLATASAGGLPDEQAALLAQVLLQAVDLGDALVAERGLDHRHAGVELGRGAWTGSQPASSSARRPGHPRAVVGWCSW
jgi:hypothetical protein